MASSTTLSTDEQGRPHAVRIDPVSPGTPMSEARETEALDAWPNVKVGGYRSTVEGIFRTFQGKDGGEGEEPLTNFPARIVASLTEDDGVETRRFIEIEALHRGEAYRFKLSTADFLSMSWPIEQLGPDAIVYAGLGRKERAREAIQVLSGQPEMRRAYGHTGWRRIGEADFYLHGDGAIGAEENLAIEMALPEALRKFALPNPPTAENLRDAVQASLRMLAVGPLHVTVPAYALIWRAIIGEADFSAWFTGQTGVFKSELAALAQQHFGAGMNGRNLPAAWQSTANANQELAFAAKDALLVVDDFVAAGSGQDANRLHRDADHLLRSQGNRSGRQRMRSDATLRPPRPPRGLILGTGEDIPRGHSLRSRLATMEIGATDIDPKKLTDCQKDAWNGRYAAATAAFIRWIAVNRLASRAKFNVRVKQLRDEAAVGTDHKRTPEITAQLGAAIELFLTFACEAGAIHETRTLWGNCWTALCKVNREQAAQQAESNPAVRFIELLRSAIASGSGHVASPDGETPEHPKAWGWRTEGADMRPKGLRVGWVDGDDLFLDRDAAHRVVQEHARATGEGMNVTAGILWKRIADAHLLKTTGKGNTKRPTLTVRRMVEGKRADVLHLAASAIVATEGSA